MIATITLCVRAFNCLCIIAIGLLLHYVSMLDKKPVD